MIKTPMPMKLSRKISLILSETESLICYRMRAPGVLLLTLHLIKIVYHCENGKWSEKEPTGFEIICKRHSRNIRNVKRANSFLYLKNTMCKIIVFADGFKSILERDLFDHLGTIIMQQSRPNTETNVINRQCSTKMKVANEVSEWISCIVKSRNHTVKY